MKENENLYLALEAINTNAQSIRSLAEVVMALFEKSENHDFSDIDFASIFQVIRRQAIYITQVSWVITPQDDRVEESEECQSIAEQVLSLREKASIHEEETAQ